MIPTAEPDRAPALLIGESVPPGAVEDDAPSRDQRWRFRTRILLYSTTGFVAALAVIYFLHPWDWAEGGVFPGGGDPLWVQAMAQVHQQAGPLGYTQHLGWPTGFSPWSHPQLGLLFGTVTWASAFVGVGSAMASLAAFAAAAALNAAACLFLFRSIVGNRLAWGSAALSFACAISPFFITKLGHFNVAAFFLVPIAIGAALRAVEIGRRRRWALAGMVLAAGIISPAWWVVVCVLFLFTGVTVCAIGARWRSAVAMGTACVPAIIALAVQIVLRLHFKVEGALPTRGPWDSNVFGGHLLDLFVGSPFLDSYTTLDEKLRPGASAELSPTGVALFVCAAVAVMMVVAHFPWAAEDLDRGHVLRTSTTISLLLFLAGGLGNVQAGLAVALGGESPARVWARMSVVLGLVGGCWILAIIVRRWDSGKVPRMLGVASVGAILVVALLDARAIPQPIAEPQEAFAEFSAVKFIEGATRPCPVAQLPEDGFPNPRVLPNQEAATIDTLYYRGFIPYLLSPNYFWTYTSWHPGAENGLQSVTTELTDAALDALAAKGFCAVLYDRTLGDAATALNIDVAGRNLVSARTPDYSDSRFVVFLLEQ